MIFNIFGHSNILGNHRNTIEFTKDEDLSLHGDCIIGVRSDFDAEQLKETISKSGSLKIIIRVDGIEEVIHAVPNKDFDSDHEIVIRKSEYASSRTLGMRSDKAAKDLSRKLITLLKDPQRAGKIEITGIP